MDILDPLLLSRWQFGLTTLYHFLFVPLTIGMALLVAIMQTFWWRTGRIHWLHLTRLFGRIFLINFAMGVVTGIVQEFQFGMNWSEYSRFVGDVFGAPLAMEGLLAFFLEATFIGLWIFGWDKLPKGVHLVTIWLTAFATILSAYFILCANAFMQNPVGYELVDGRARLTDIGAVLTNQVALAAFPHTLMASIMFAAVVIVATAAWHLMRGKHVGEMRTALKFGAITNVIAFAGAVFTGDQLGLAMVRTQPMKMAAAEALYNTATGADASFSIFSLGTPDGTSEIFSLRIPYLLSFLSTHTFNGTVEGINQLQAEYVQQFGPGDYSPIIWVTYWAFRWMIGLGVLSMLLTLAALWFTRKGRTLPKWAWRVGIWAAPLPMLASLVGWIFTEMGRQPWIVFGLMKTADGVSNNPGWMIAISLAAFTVVYGALAVVEFRLIRKAVIHGPDDWDAVHAETPARELATVY